MHREDMRRRDSRVQPHVVGLAPAITLAAQLVCDRAASGQIDAERIAVQPDSSLPRLAGIQVYHDKDRVGRQKLPLSGRSKRQHGWRCLKSANFILARNIPEG